MKDDCCGCEEPTGFELIDGDCCDFDLHGKTVTIEVNGRVFDAEQVSEAEYAMLFLAGKPCMRLDRFYYRLAAS